MGCYNQGGYAANPSSVGRILNLNQGAGARIRTGGLLFTNNAQSVRGVWLCSPQIWKSADLSMVYHVFRPGPPQWGSVWGSSRMQTYRAAGLAVEAGTHVF